MESKSVEIELFERESRRRAFSIPELLRTNTLNYHELAWDKYNSLELKLNLTSK